MALTDHSAQTDTNINLMETFVLFTLNQQRAKNLRGFQL